MSAGASISAVLHDADGALGALDAALKRTFGVSFDLWLGETSGTSWRREKPAAAEGRPRNDPTGLTELLQAALENADAPLVKTQSGGRHLVAIPIQRDGAPPVVAVATLSMTSQELWQRLGDSFIREFRWSQTLKANRLELESYTRQISQDFEELTYLQGLAEHIELCDIARSVSDVTQTVLPVLRELIRAESLVFVLARPGPKNRARQAVRVDSPTVWVGPRILSDEACCKLVERYRVAAAQQPVVKNRQAVESESPGIAGLECFLLTPAGKDNYCAGWLLALNRVEAPRTVESPDGSPGSGLSCNEFGTVEAGLMGVAAVMLATHARNVEIFEDEKTLLIGIVRALINAVDAKDTYTCGHSDRVALIAKRLGEELGLPQETSEQLYLAGLLHDIGKIGVPDEVLRKPGKLTDDEFAEIKRHPQRGFAILQNLDHLSYVVPSVMHHHERCDGKGYPCGLADEKIPFAARIVAVADAYDAMSSSRPYREAMPEERVKTILKEGAGTQWDGRVVDAFFRALPDLRAICVSSGAHTRNILGLNERALTDHEPVADDPIAAAVSTTHTK